MIDNVLLQKQDLTKIANVYINALVTKNVDIIPLAENAIMTNPLASDTKFEGKENIKKFMKDIFFADFNFVNDKIEKYISGKNCIAIMWEASCYPGNILVSFFDYIEVADGTIITIKSYFDPRGLLAMLKIDPGYFY